MFCSNCGKEMKDTEKFCTHCGARVAEEAPVMPEAVAEVTPEVVTPEVAAPEAVMPEVVTPEIAAPEAVMPEVVTPEVAAPVQETPVYTAAPVEPQAPTYTEAQPYVENPAYAPAYTAPQAPEVKPKKKKGKIVLGVILAVIVALGVVIALNFQAFANFAMRTFSSPEKYYQYVEKRGLEDAVESFGDMYENYFLKSFNVEGAGGEAKIDITLSDTVISMIESYSASSGISDFSWLKNISLTAVGAVEDNMTQSKIGVGLGGADVLTIDAIVDMETGYTYLGLPGLLDTYAGVYDESTSSEEFQEVMEMIEMIGEVAPDRKTVESLLSACLEAAVGAMDDVSKSSEVLSVDEISGKYTCLKVTIDAETAVKMAEAVLKEFKSNKDLKKIIMDVSSIDESVDGDEIYEEFVETLEIAIDEMGKVKAELRNSDATSEEAIIMNVYVDGKGNICGREFIVEQYGMEQGKFGYIVPEKGNKFGLDIYGEVQGVKASFTGTGKRSGDKVNGDFALSVAGIEIMEAQATDFNTKDLNKGYLNGGLVLRLTDTIGQYAGIASLSDYEMVMNFKSDEKTSNSSCVIKNSTEEFVSIVCDQTYTEDGTVTLPDPNNVVMLQSDEDVAYWIMGMDFQKLIDSLRTAGFPSDILDELEYGLSYMY